jgi:hypothetical protein
MAAQLLWRNYLINGSLDSDEKRKDIFKKQY